MARTIEFTKMQGAGNDYIYVNTIAFPLDNPQDLAIKWSAYHTGIGSDGLVLIGTSEKADFSMRIFNNDGSEAMMCGNASRCIGKYLYDKHLTDKTTISLETLSGIKILQLHISDQSRQVESVTVDMDVPIISAPQQLATENGQMQDDLIRTHEHLYKGTFVSMGNPHCVIFVDDINKVDIATEGPQLEHYPLFPQRCNIEFAQVLDGGKIRMRVWERGSGITMACGTGACATAVAAALTGRNGKHSTIIMDGGELEIEWKDDQHIYMTGPAETVFEGQITI